MRSLPIALIAAAAGCGSSIDLSSGLGSCSMQVTVKGGAAQSVSCIAEGVSGSTHAVNISMTGSLPDVSAAGLLITLAAPPTAGTYGPANVADSGGTVALKNTNAKWVESQNQGSFQVVLTTVTAVGTQQGGTAYALRGSMTATLLPQPGTAASGNATISASF